MFVSEDFLFASTTTFSHHISHISELELQLILKNRESLQRGFNERSVFNAEVAFSFSEDEIQEMANNG